MKTKTDRLAIANVLTVCLKALLCVVISSFVVEEVNAQQLKVSKFRADPADVAAVVYQKHDLNGNPCALVKVDLVYADVRFEGDIIDSERKGGEYWVYLIDGAKWLNLEVPGFLKLRYDFPGLEKNTTYIMQVVKTDAPDDSDDRVSTFDLIEKAKDFYNSRNYEDAFRLFLQAATLGDDEAQCDVAVCYFNGQGTARNYMKAFDWYSKSAAQGNYTAGFNLGICYYNGYGTVKNYSHAFEIFKDYAERGEDSAKFNLAMCYELGQGTAKDLAKAREIYLELAAKGDSQSAERLKNINRISQPKRRF